MAEEKALYSPQINKLMKEKPTNLKPWEEAVYKEGFAAGLRAASGDLGSLHLAEKALLQATRALKYGVLTVKVQHSLPERGENVRESMIFNARGGK